MVFKDLCVLVLRMKVASALEGLRIKRYDIGKNGTVCYLNNTVNGTLLSRSGKRSWTEEDRGRPAARTVISYCTAMLLYYNIYGWIPLPFQC